MAYRKKIYVSFDTDDILYFNMLQAWCASDTQEFIHFVLNIPDKASPKIIENAEKTVSEKIAATSCVIILVSDHTLPLCLQMKMELSQAIALNKPIIVANLNGKRSIDNDLCPEILKNQMAVHLSFNAKIIQRAIDTWPSYCKQNAESESSAYFFKPKVYQNLGL